MVTSLLGKPLPHNLDEATLATLADLFAASALLPRSHGRGAEIRHARQLLETQDPAGAACLERLKVKLLGGAA